jgi:predicted GIY-YIG superfamily endonuclease
MWSCYILYSINEKYSNHTYIGKTNDLARRLRQHNGEIAGGARATKMKKPHDFLCIISGFETENIALKYEWNFKHPERKKKHKRKYSGILGRLRSVEYVFNNYPLSESSCIDIFVNKKYIHIFGLKENDTRIIECI